MGVIVVPEGAGAVGVGDGLSPSPVCGIWVKEGLGLLEAVWQSRFLPLPFAVASAQSCRSSPSPGEPPEPRGRSGTGSSRPSWPS